MSRTDQPRRVLFLSTRNAARSLMAEVWLRGLGGDRFAVASAGTHPAEAVDPMVVEVMREVNHDVSAAAPRSSAGLRGQDFDLVIVLCPREGESMPHLEGAPEVMNWSFDDPSAEDQPEDERRRRTYRRLRDELRTRVSLFVNATTDALRAAPDKGQDAAPLR